MDYIVVTLVRGGQLYGSGHYSLANDTKGVRHQWPRHASQLYEESRFSYNKSTANVGNIVHIPGVMVL